MANNRMYLFNENTGEMVYLGKYFPSTGWYYDGELQRKPMSNFKKFVLKILGIELPSSTLSKCLNDAFDKVDFDLLPKTDIPVGAFGDTSWTIKYESTDSGENEIENYSEEAA